MKTKNLFLQHPNLKEYYETSDGTKFYKNDSAKAHARTLEDDKVTRHRRVDADLPKDEKASGVNTATQTTSPKSNGTGVSAAAQAKLDIAHITTLKTEEEVTAFLEGKTAKSVKKAAKKQVEAINVATKVQLDIEAINKLESVEEVDKAVKDVKNAEILAAALARKTAIVSANKAVKKQQELDNQ